MSENKEKVVEKEVKDEKKNSGKKIEKKSNKSTKKDKNSFINKDNYLYYTFGLLVVIVIVLAILVLVSRNSNNSKSNVVMPIINDYVNNEMNIDMVNLANKGDYSIKVTNYRNDIINKEDINYTMTITNSSDANIKVTKDDDSNNLIKNSKTWVINDVALGNNTKSETVYHFSVIDKNKVKKGDSINIKIES